jgi:hypothetical protein
MMAKTIPPFPYAPPKKISLQYLRTFGCRVYVRNPGDRPSKLDLNNHTGIFLGYANTMKNIFWYDNTGNTVKIAPHILFDEGMLDMDSPPPNVKILRCAQDGLVTLMDDCHIKTPVDFSFELSPFRVLQVWP